MEVPIPEFASTSTSKTIAFKVKEAKYERDEFKKENLNLTTKLQIVSEEKLDLADTNQQLEMKLMSALEKNKFCQSEVMSRDQSIINLRSDCQLVDEKYQSGQQELKIQQEEIERLNVRVKNLQFEVKEVQAINEHLEAAKSGLEAVLKQKDYDVEVLRQDLMKMERQHENLRLDWSANVRNHDEEIRGYKQNFQNLNEELAHTKNDLVEFMEKINLLKGICYYYFDYYYDHVGFSMKNLMISQRESQWRKSHENFIKENNKRISTGGL